MASKKVLEHYLRQVRLIEEHREKWCEQNVRRHYRDLMKDLQEFLGVEYAKLAQDDKLTYEILHAKGQYARFIEEIEQKTSYFNGKAAQEIRDTVQLTYQKCFEGMVDAVEKSETFEQLNVNLKGLRAVRPEIIKNVVKNSFMEDALEKNHKTVIYDIKQQIGVGLSQGDRMSTMARRISEQLDKDYKRSVMIARTECHRVREAGFQDSSQEVSQKLKSSDSDYVLVKTWKTMEDLSVRPYRIKGKKGSKTVIKGKGPDHVKMHGVTVLVDDMFDLGGGVKAITPGQSGVASHDINCRCYASRDLMLKSEYEKISGKKLEEYDPAKKYEQKEQVLLDNKTDLEAQKEKLEQRKSNLESYEYKNIWKDPVTPADYAVKKSKIQAKRDYYNAEIDAAKNHIGKYSNPNIYTDDVVNKIVSANENYLKLLDDFEAQGKAYLKIMDELDDVSNKILDTDDQIKAIRVKIMKAKGIDLGAMQDEIDDLIDEINKLKKGNKVKLVDGKSTQKELYKISDKITEKEADGTVQCHTSVGDLKAYLAKQSDFDFVEFIEWDENKWDDVAKELQKLKFKSKSDDINFLIEDIADFTVNGHSFIKIGNKQYVDPYLKSLGVSQKEIDKFDEILEEIYEKVGIKSSKNAVSKNLTLKSKISEFTEDQLEKAYEAATGFQTTLFKGSAFQDKTVEWFTDNVLPATQQAKFKQELKKIVKTVDKLEDAIDDVNLKKIEKLEKQLAKKQDELAKIRKRYGLEDDTFSQTRKDAAYWFTDKNGGGEAADNVLRDKCGEIWRKASAALKKSAYEYTQSYHKYNEPLRGIEYGTNNFIGVGKVDLNDIGVSTGYGYSKGQVKKLIDDLTDIIDESTYNFDYWVQRGCRYDGMDKFFNVGARDFYDLTEKQMQEKLLGTTPTEYAFMSTGVAKGKGLNTSGHGITLNIYAPKGTKMLYCEPFSAFGNGDGRSWDGKSKQSSVGYEAELLLQRNTKFRVTKVEKSGSRWFIDMDVISQER